MNQPARKTEWLVWGGLALIILGIVAAFIRSQLSPAEMSLPVMGHIPDTHLTNQNSEAVSLASLRGQVWVADIIFTRCPGPCVKMTQKLADLAAMLPADMPVRLVSFSSDPEYDSPAELKKFGAHFKVDAARWWFLTGTKRDIWNLALNDFKYILKENQPVDGKMPEGLITHSTSFALVDQSGQMRGWVDGLGREHAFFESDDPDALAQLLPAIKQLLRHAPK